MKKISLKDIDPAQAIFLKEEKVAYPYLMPMQPYGLMTGEIEALTSYIMRLAEKYGEWPRPFMTRMFDLYLPKELHPKNKTNPVKGLHSINGTGVWVDRYATALSVGTNGEVDAFSLTLKPLQYLADKRIRGFLKNRLEWCPHCWLEDQEQGRMPYVRLYWLIQQTKVCTKHMTRLQQECPRCHEKQNLYCYIPRQWVCVGCGHSLHKNYKARKEDEAFTPDEQWGAFALYKLVERVNANTFEVTSETVSKSLSRFLQSQKKTVGELAERLNVEVTSIERMLRPAGHPFFPALLDMCYRLDIPIDQFLFDQDLLTSPSNWRVLSRPRFVASSNVDAKKKKAVYRTLRKTIDKNENPPPKISDIARKHNIDYNVIQYNFPLEYAEIKRRYAKWDKEVRKNKVHDRIDRLVRGITELGRNNVYPSNRKLRDLGYLQPHDLRRDDVICILKAFQEVYRDMGLYAPD